MTKKLSVLLSVLTLIMIFSYFLINFNYIFKSGITGYQVMSTRLVIVSAVSTSCNMTLQTGLNLVSFPCIDQDISINDFFANFSDYNSLRFYIPNINDPWKSYNPMLPNWTIQDLESISRRYGYWINVENNTRLYLNGTLATPTLSDLPTGWSLLGYPSRTERPINDTFNQLIPNYDYVYLYNASDTFDPWKEYTWNSSLPSNKDLNYTHMYYGYWIYLFNPDTFVVN